MESIWTQAVDVIRSRVSEEIFETYFAPLRFLSGDETQIKIAAVDPFFCYWVQEHYNDLLLNAVTQAAGRPLEVILDTEAIEPEALLTRASLSEGGDEDIKDELLGSSFTLNPHYTFENFVLGPNNEMAHAMSAAVAREPAEAFNPLFIYGGTGLGKTHLLHAIAHRILAANPEARIVYISAEEFMNQMIRVLTQKSARGMEHFRARYRESCDVLLMDDIHILEGKDRSQEEFFHTFNALHSAQKQIVLTSDRTPKEFQDLSDRLRSRFTWGMLTDIKPPLFETRVAILQRKAIQEDARMPMEVLHYIARTVSANVRELEGALTRLLAFASIRKRPVTVEFAASVLGEVVDEARVVRDITAIQQMVAEHFNVQVSDLCGARRMKAIAHPRALAMYLCRTHTRSSFPQIGRDFGGRDHSTVMAAVRRIAQELEKDEALKAELTKLERKLP
ncbi:chromosomal replication initiator protein DnaA [Myxococcota bacterium]|nr:chromosomal replication initiator protein DnaA [Myxococcota bacterium]MBU1431499.1 chromosomal replication initiator protein DnaA [Myxococcota bacterium]MBU1898152.1 chromosomal replication initiator protein DnaA [Myxococcota bacterium]